MDIKTIIYLLYSIVMININLLSSKFNVFIIFIIIYYNEWTIGNINNNFKNYFLNFFNKIKNILIINKK